MLYCDILFWIQHRVFVSSFALQEKNTCAGFYWIPTCVTIPTYRTYISETLNMWIIVPTVIFVLYKLVMLDVAPYPIIKNLWCYGHYFLLMVVMNATFPSMNVRNFYHWITTRFHLILYIRNWLVFIVVRIFTML